MAKYKYLKVEVSRTETTDLYVRVPEEFETCNLASLEYRRHLADIAEDTTDRLDWERESVIGRVCSIKAVTESEARKYAVGEVN